jgi:hypothetical protein
MDRGKFGFLAKTYCGNGIYVMIRALLRGMEPLKGYFFS